MPQCLAAQQRWNHVYVLLHVVGHTAERQSQQAVGTYRGDAGEHLQHFERETVDTRELEVAVQEQVLVAYAYLRGLRTAKQVGEAGE